MGDGKLTAAIIIVVIVIVILLLVVFRASYAQSPSDYGEWSPFNTTLCLNEGQGCSVEGTSQRYRTCTPNATTGFGCIDTSGVHTFKPEVEDVPCNVVCFTSVWENVNTTSCSVFDDVQGTILGASQVCRNPDQFTLIKATRECVVQDSTGTNACVKSNGSLASVGEQETLLIPCSTLPDCFEGEWGPCPPSGITVSEDCGAPSGDCGRLILDSNSAKCFQDIGGNQVEVSSSNCYPPDDPGPCDRQCFNFPCTTYPAGYANISDLISDGSDSVFVELYDSVSGDYLCADWVLTQQADAIAQQDILGTSDVDTSFQAAGDHMRFRIIPSQLYAADGAFYLLAHLPYSGQTGIAFWNATKITVKEFDLPGVLGETLDDVLPAEELFNFVGGSAPYILNQYVPGPTLTDLFCSGVGCINATLCTEPWNNVDDVCV